MFHMLLVKLESVMMLKSVSLEGTGYADTPQYPLGIVPGYLRHTKTLECSNPLCKIVWYFPISPHTPDMFKTISRWLSVPNKI